MFKVRNVSGTANRSCACGTWLRHWLNFSGQTAEFCAVPGCLGTDLVGAHVQVVGGDGTTYIVPLCQAHNQQSGVIFLPDWLAFVHANKARTCERPGY